MKPEIDADVAARIAKMDREKRIAMVEELEKVIWHLRHSSPWAPSSPSRDWHPPFNRN
jgi:hypothetical protein